MRRAVWASGILVMLAVAVAPARASLITVDPDSLPGGNLSNAFPGVTLVALGQEDPAVYSIENVTLASTGSWIFGNGQNGLEWGDGFNEGMRADFTRPTSFVAIDIIGNDAADIGRLIAYDRLDNVLDVYTTSVLTTGVFETAWISSPRNDIAYVVATGSENNAESVSLDHLQFRVPEPGILLLLGSGLAALGLLHRWRRRG